MKKIRLIFWLHFAFALVSHIMIPIMLVGMIKLLLTWELGFALSGLVLGTTFFSCTYLVNHITNVESGFCYLTWLENFYRRQQGLPEVNNFLPRFYSTCRKILSCFKN